MGGSAPAPASGGPPLYVLRWVRQSELPAGPELEHHWRAGDSIRGEAAGRLGPVSLTVGPPGLHDGDEFVFFLAERRGSGLNLRAFSTWRRGLFTGDVIAAGFRGRIAAS